VDVVVSLYTRDVVEELCISLFLVDAGLLVSSSLYEFVMYILPDMRVYIQRRALHIHRYCGFSGLGESTSVMFCGSFHA
jgi:hypothetical protein